MNGKKLIIEKLKSILIVVLTLSTILLLYFFWSDICIMDLSLDDFNLDFSDVEMAERYTFPEDVIIPTYIEIISEAGESRIVQSPSQLYGKKADLDSFAGTLTQFFASGEVALEEISKDLYKEVFQYSSVKSEFDYLLPAREYIEFFGASKLAGIGGISTISEIGFSEAAPDSLFIYDKNLDKCYRIVCGTQLGYVSSVLENEELENYPICYKITDYMGMQVSNQLKIPLYLSTNMNEMSVAPLVSPEDDSRSNEEAKTFFGNTFDFVRKLEDAGGKITYMYGYGETVLIMDVDGSVEYKSANDGSSGMGFYEALDVALSFVDLHSIPQPTSAADSKYVLSSVKIDNSDKKTYGFEFEIEAGNENVFYEKAPLAVEVKGGVVTYCYMSVPVLTGNKTANQEAFSAINTIATNYKYIAHKIDLAKRQDTEDAKGTAISIDSVAERIEDMRYGYLIIGEKAIPTWEIRIKNLEEPRYFDLYTAAPVER